MPTVLIADDDPVHRALVRAALEADGHEVVEAADGDAAWRLLQEHRPAVAVLDLQMPGRDGLELTRAARADPLLGRTYIILLTGQGRGDLAEQLIESGAQRFLLKPFSPAVLRQAVRQGIELA